MGFVQLCSARTFQPLRIQTTDFSWIGDQVTVLSHCSNRVLWLHWMANLAYDNEVQRSVEFASHLDTEHNYPCSIITDRIAPENVHRLIAGIRALRGWAT